MKINKSDNLYLIRSFGDQTSLVKLGYSTQIISRLNQYLSHNPFIEVIGTFYRKDAKQFEKLTHTSLTPIYKKEWYDESDLGVIIEKLGIEISTISHPLKDVLNDRCN